MRSGFGIGGARNPHPRLDQVLVAAGVAAA